MNTHRIFVLGHMGTGKYIFTEALANRLGWQVVDANPSIERYIGRATKDILGEQGEAAFNRAQADIITHCLGKNHVVVLLEECAITSIDCRKLLADAFVVYLKVSIDTQLGRMKHGRIPALPIEDLRAFLTAQHKERDAYFEQVASLVVESEGFSEDPAVINKIIEKDIATVLGALT